MELVMLGTGYGTAVNCYNTCFAFRRGEETLLVDTGGGNGILRILQEQKIPLASIHHIIMTHSHSDHVLGLNWIFRVLQQAIAHDRYEGALHVYACREVLDDIVALNAILLRKKITEYYGTRILLEEITDGETREILGNQVTFFDLHSTKQTQFGHVIRTPEGIAIGVCGDEPLTAVNEHYMQGADWMLHEAFCLKDDADRFHPYEKHHSTVFDACSTAERLGVKNLVLYHTEDTDPAHRKARYTQEGQQVYHGHLYVPDDGEILRIVPDRR